MDITTSPIISTDESYSTPNQTNSDPHPTIWSSLQLDLTMSVILSVLVLIICCLCLLLIQNHYRNKVREMALRTAVNKQISTKIIKEVTEQRTSVLRTSPQINYTADEMHFHYARGGGHAAGAQYNDHRPPPPPPDHAAALNIADPVRVGPSVLDADRPSTTSTNTVDIDMTSTVDGEGYADQIAPAMSPHHFDQNFYYHNQRESPRDTLQKALSADLKPFDARHRDLNPLNELQDEEEMKGPILNSAYWSDSKPNIIIPDLEFKDLDNLELGANNDMISTASWNSSQMYAHGQAAGDRPRVGQQGHAPENSRWRSEGHLKGQSGQSSILEQEQSREMATLGRPKYSMYTENSNTAGDVGDV